jgi:hypothetical protein
MRDSALKSARDAEARRDWLDAAAWYNVAIIGERKSEGTEDFETPADKVRRAWYLERLEEFNSLRGTDPVGAWKIAQGLSRSSVWLNTADIPTAERASSEARDAWLKQVASTVDARLAQGDAMGARNEVLSYLASIDPRLQGNPKLPLPPQVAPAEALLPRISDAIIDEDIKRGELCVSEGKDARKYAASLLKGPLKPSKAGAERVAAFAQRADAAVARSQVDAALTNPSRDTGDPALTWASWGATVEAAKVSQDPAALKRAVDGRRSFALQFAQRLEAENKTIVSVARAQLLKAMLDADGIEGPHVGPVRVRYDAALAGYRKEASAAKSASSAALWANVFKSVGQPMTGDHTHADVLAELGLNRPTWVVVGVHPKCAGLFNFADLPQGKGPRVVVDASAVTCSQWDSSFAPTPAQLAQKTKQSCRMVPRSTVVTVDKPCGQETVNMGSDNNRWSYIRGRSCATQETVTWQEEVCSNETAVEVARPGTSGRRVRGVTTHGLLWIKSDKDKLAVDASRHVSQDVNASPGQAAPAMLPHAQIFRENAGGIGVQVAAAVATLGKPAAETRETALRQQAAGAGPDAVAARDQLLAADRIMPPGAEALAAALGLEAQFIGKFIREEYKPVLPTGVAKTPTANLPPCGAQPTVPPSAPPAVPFHVYRVTDPTKLGVSKEDVQRYRFKDHRGHWL